MSTSPHPALLRNPLFAHSTNQLDVLFVIRSLRTGGAERQLVRLLHLLSPRLAVGVVHFDASAGTEIELRRRGVRVVALPKAARWAVRPYAGLLMAFARLRPRVVHGYMPDGNIFATAARSFGARVVWGIRGSERDMSIYSRLSRATLRMETALCRAADLVIANSVAGRNYALRRGFPPLRLRVIPNGIDTDTFSRVRTPALVLRAHHGIPPTAPVLLVVGRLDPIKRQTLAVRVLAALGHRSAHLIFAGRSSSQYGEEVFRLSATLGVQSRVHFLGEVDGMAHVYSAADILLSTSASEGFSNAIAESMSCGTPAVATDVGDSSQIVGSTGAIVSSASVTALVAATDRLLQSVRSNEATMRGAARQRVTDLYAEHLLRERTLGALSPLLRH